MSPGSPLPGGLILRDGQAGDLKPIVALYNHYVTHSPCTFDIQVRTMEQRRPWMARFAASGPWRLLTAWQGQGLAGYACSTPFRPKAAYGTSVETTIYLAPEHQGAGLGNALYSALLSRLEDEPGVHRAYGVVVLPNPASERLHRRLGYRQAAHLHQVGHKFGRFWDVVWFEKDLSGGDG